jgi:hypothetical protein
VHAWSTFNRVFTGWANVVGGEVFVRTPLPDGIIGTVEGMVAKALAAGPLGQVVEAEVAFQSEGGGEGRQAGFLGDVLSLGAGDRDDNRGCRFSFTTFIKSEPAAFLE